MRGGGVGHPETEIMGAGGRSPKNFSRPFGLQFGLKIRGGPGPFPGSATVKTENNSGPICFQKG